MLASSSGSGVEGIFLAKLDEGVAAQILSVVTASQLERVFSQRCNFDLRRLLAGSERFLDSLCDLMDRDPSFLLGAVRCLPLAPALRDQITQAMLKHFNSDVIKAVKGASRRYAERLAAEERPSKRMRIDAEQSSPNVELTNDQAKKEVAEAERMIKNADLLIQRGMKLKNFSDIESGRAKLVFGLLVAEQQLVALVGMRKYQLHHVDLHLLLNLVHASESFKTAEAWTPVCLPKFDPR
ncbi:hypothetical protein HPB52_000946 [Rhipicephalus sanguineus]|uniref:Vacuolar fusion protein MON1 homolog n=1 Tax=Rhipicephalus sanguineus TaxID=34632 RepID=A0A9D4PM15_RHISA|nr:hypothetical protein HPB52_000946 [Rhipicephalus sanguineus]